MVSPLKHVAFEVLEFYSFSKIASRSLAGVVSGDGILDRVDVVAKGEASIGIRHAFLTFSAIRQTLHGAVIEHTDAHSAQRNRSATRRASTGGD